MLKTCQLLSNGRRSSVQKNFRRGPLNNYMEKSIKGIIFNLFKLNLKVAFSNKTFLCITQPAMELLAVGYCRRLKLKVCKKLLNKFIAIKPVQDCNFKVVCLKPVWLGRQYLRERFKGTILDHKPQHKY